MGRKRNNSKEFWKNNRTYIKWYRRLKKIAVSRFEWINLPPTVDERFLEMCLFENGKAIFFQDEVLGYLVMKCTIQGQLNVYNIPIQRLAYANNGYQVNLDETNSVVIFNDYLRNTGHETVEYNAYDLYLTNTIKNININAQKTPIILRARDGQKLTVQNLFEQYEGNVPVIYETSDLDPEALSCLKMDAPFVADKLQVLQAELWNEALTDLGIPNVVQSKKSVLLTDEVERMQGGAFSCRYSELAMRQQACREINAMFGLDIDVRYRVDGEMERLVNINIPESESMREELEE